MVKVLRFSLFAVSLAVAAGLSHGEGEPKPLYESATWAFCMSGDAASCDEIGQAAFEQAEELQDSGVTTSQVGQDLLSNLDLARDAWEKGCHLDYASACTNLGKFYHATRRGPMLSVRAYNQGCTLGDDAACTIVQAFKDKGQNELLPCFVETERDIGAVPWVFRVWGTVTEMYAAGFTLRGQLILDFGEKHALVNTATVQKEDIPRFVFEPDWLNTLVRNGDLKIDYIGKSQQNNWGFRMSGNESGTQALLAQLGSGQGISYDIDFSNSPYGSRVPEHQSGEITHQSYPQALEFSRVIRQHIQNEAEQGLCNPNL